MSEDKRSWSERIKDAGQYNDLREYQQLKTANEMEREATARLKEHLKRKHGDAGADAMMKAKGYNPDLLK